MKKKTYYKVTTEKDGKQYSFYVFNSKAEVEYKPGEWAEAPTWLAKHGYGLFVFDSLKNAKNFISKCYANPKLFSCEVEGKFKSLPSAITMTGLSSGEIIEIPCNNWPEGTVMVRRVKLIKQKGKKVKVRKKK